jgi:muconolactone D-isomerase
MNFLVKATPTRRLLDLSADDLDDLMAGERTVASALIVEGTIIWMWRLPGTDTSLTIWNAESAEALDLHLERLPVFPYNDVEITALAAHPAFPTSLRATPPAIPAR